MKEKIRVKINENDKPADQCSTPTCKRKKAHRDAFCEICRKDLIKNAFGTERIIEDDKIFYKSIKVLRA